GKIIVSILIEAVWKSGSSPSREKSSTGLVLRLLIPLLLLFAGTVLLVMGSGFSPKVQITKGRDVEMENRFIKIPYLRRSLRARDVIAVGTDSKSSDVLLHTTWKGKIRTWKIKLADEEVVPALAATIRSRIFGPAPPPR
ncbi:MAG: hypothetical protein O6952_06745, partial [Planctomycetota bacterium]|nr:hypothetical protein [Planctomycetota bacterium]